MRIRRQITCPLELAHDVVRGKWKPIIVWSLLEGRSLAALERSIQGISQKMLLEHLKELMEFDVVRKRSWEGYPLRVEYRLTARGRRLREAIGILQGIGTEIQAGLPGEPDDTHENVGN